MNLYRLEGGASDKCGIGNQVMPTPSGDRQICSYSDKERMDICPECSYQTTRDHGSGRVILIGLTH
ncbi:MAG: hypothetical protein QNJ32_30590 [Xenococcaceae cyanobacterium MO_167.B27]|nr:hypothetical protein [Xenococcaceae cyanobacterium MO_167.B27]